MVNSETYHFMVGSLILLRLLGSVIFIDFYRKRRGRRFLVLALATLCYAMSPTIDLFIQAIKETDLYYFLYFASELFTPLAFMLFIFVFFRYTRADISNQWWILGFTSILVIGLLYPLVQFEIGLAFITLLNIVLVLITIEHILRNWNLLTQLAENSAYFFFVSAIIVFLNLLVGLINPTPETQFLQYAGNMIMSIFVVFIFVHLEYNRLSIQKYLMKDNYSHSVAQILQVLIGRLEAVLTNKDDSEAKELIEEAIEDCLKVGDQLTTIRRI
jgi:hypothetical protein